MGLHAGKGFTGNTIRAIRGFFANGIDSQCEGFGFGDENVATKFGYVIKVIDRFLAGRKTDKEDEKIHDRKGKAKPPLL